MEKNALNLDFDGIVISAPEIVWSEVNSEQVATHCRSQIAKLTACLAQLAFLLQADHLKLRLIFSETSKGQGRRRSGRLKLAEKTEIAHQELDGPHKHSDKGVKH